MGDAILWCGDDGDDGSETDGDEVDVDVGVDLGVWSSKVLMMMLVRLLLLLMMIMMMMMIMMILVKMMMMIDWFT